MSGNLFAPPLLKDGHAVWCVDEEKDATTMCAMRQHKMAIKADVEKEDGPNDPPPPPPHFVRILQEIAEERRRQRDDHGWTAAHDDNLTPPQWAWLLSQRVTTLLAPTIRPDDMRRCLIELAAISTATVEAIDRAEKRQGF